MKHLLRQLWIVIGALVAAFVVSWVIYMPNADERGIWRAQTGGALITLNRFQAKLYSESPLTCVHDLTFPAHLKLVELAEGATIEAADNVMLLHDSGSVDPTPFVRIDALPDNCGPVDPDTATPRAVFDTAWAAMDKHYAFFDLHGVNWDARRALAPPADANMNDAQTMDMLLALTEGLDDGHVHFGSDALGYRSPAVAPDWFVPDAPFRRNDLVQIARDTVGTPLTSIDLTGVEYTLLPDGVGYILIRHMAVDTPFGTTEGKAMARAFEQVATALQDASALIIDIRYNPGGSDGVSLGIAGHFTAQPVDVFTKTTRDGDSQTAPFTATLQPQDTTPLAQPVILLTTRLTGSAAEILTLALRELPQVTTMGEPSSGGLSDVLGFTLPNGWGLGLSHQTYRTMNGELYEAIGIPPDVPFQIETAPLLDGQDPLLRAAFERARAL